MTHVLLLAVRTARAADWRALVAGGVVGVLFAGLVGRGGSPTADEVLAAVRLAAVTIALGVAFLFDDPAARLLAPLPASWARRAVARYAVAAAGAAVPAAAVLALAAGKRLSDVPRLPLGDVAMEVATVVGVAVAAAALTRRAGAHRPGMHVAIGVLVCGALSAAVPGAARPWASPGEPATAAAARWASVHRGWWVAAGLVVVALAVAAVPRPRLLRAEAQR